MKVYVVSAGWYDDERILKVILEDELEEAKAFYENKMKTASNDHWIDIVEYDTGMNQNDGDSGMEWTYYGKVNIYRKK